MCYSLTILRISVRASVRALFKLSYRNDYYDYAYSFKDIKASIRAQHGILCCISEIYLYNSPS